MIIDKLRELLTNTVTKTGYQHDDGQTSYDTGNLTWEWKNTVGTNTSIRGTSLSLGFYTPQKDRIRVNLGSIMLMADNEEQAMFHLEETVLHELTHWADEHSAIGGRQRHTDSNHSERYRKILKPLTRHSDSEAGEFDLDNYDFLRKNHPDKTNGIGF